MTLRTLFLSTIALTSTLSVFALTARAHCEIPCGIYSDTMRIQMILEDCDTIQKSMDQIKTIGGENYNQLVRWISNKDDHADKIQGVVTQYFMTQRVKPLTADEDPTDYHRKIGTLHEILVEAMKCKQTTDAAHVDNIRRLVDVFSHAYFSAEDLQHVHPEAGP